MAVLTAGFTCPPLMPPIRKMMAANVKPMTIADPPETKMDITRAKVPNNSDINAAGFISNCNGDKFGQILHPEAMKTKDL